MRRVYLFALTTVVAPLTCASSAWALCTGPTASIEQLTKFDNDSAGWLQAEPAVPPIKDQSDLIALAPATKLVSDIRAIANAAVNDQDQKYLTALQTMLATASGDQGAFIGRALASLGTTCTTAQDKRYLASIATAIAGSQNARANIEYGEASNPIQTAATGGGGSGGGGTGGGGTSEFGPLASFFGSTIPGNTIPEGSTGTPNFGDGQLNNINLDGGASVGPNASKTTLLTSGGTGAAGGSTPVSAN